MHLCHFVIVASAVYPARPCFFLFFTVLGSKEDCPFSVKCEAAGFAFKHKMLNSPHPPGSMGCWLSWAEFGLGTVASWGRWGMAKGWPTRDCDIADCGRETSLLFLSFLGDVALKVT